jgi:hypothetical protein
MAAHECVERGGLAAAEPLDELEIGVGKLGHALQKRT